MPRTQIERRPVSFVHAFSPVLVMVFSDSKATAPGCGRLDEPDDPGRLERELRSRVIDELDRFSKADFGGGARGDFPRTPVDGLGRLPVLEVERIALREEDGVLASLGPEPESILAAEDVDVGLPLLPGDRSAVEPAEARSRCAPGGRGHDPALVLRHHRHAGFPRSVRELDHILVLLQKRQIIAISLHRGCALFRRCLGRGRLAAPAGGQEGEGQNRVSHRGILYDVVPFAGGFG